MFKFANSCIPDALTISGVHHGAGVQYLGHEGTVTAMCIIPNSSQLVASCDSGGTCHVWSAASGVLAMHFCEAGSGLIAPPTLSKPYSCEEQGELCKILNQEGY